MKQSCRFCRCTWDHGCPVGCYWAEPDLCSVCAGFKTQLHEYVRTTRSASHASLASMLDEVTIAHTGKVAEPPPRDHQTVTITIQAVEGGEREITLGFDPPISAVDGHKPSAAESLAMHIFDLITRPNPDVRETQ